MQVADMKVVANLLRNYQGFLEREASKWAGLTPAEDFLRKSKEAGLAADQLEKYAPELTLFTTLDIVEGDCLPSLGEVVHIHLGRQDAWVEHTVVGYYVWKDHGGNESLHRVFVRVIDKDGYPNARLLKDVRRKS